MKPHLTLKCMLVHSKDKRTPHDTAGVVYQISCKDCPNVYTEETGRRFSKDVDSVGEKKFTRARRKESVEEYQPSALTDHVAQSNHTIDWHVVKLPMSESHCKISGIKETVQICKMGPHTMNQDGSRHQLPDVYTGLLTTAPHVGARQP